MELRQLRTFVAIADAGCFSEASKQLFITQSAVSQQIRTLEEELGTQLFVRDAHGVTLTESGQEILPLARNVLGSADACQHRITELKGLLCGELNIGLTSTLEPFIRQTLLDFMRLYPKVHVNVLYKTLPELLMKIHDHEIDLMLSMMPTSTHDFIASDQLMSYRLMAIMRRSHPLAHKAALTFSDLRSHPLILPERGLNDRNAIESFLHADTGQLNIRSIVSDANAILNMLQISNYISILAPHVISGRPDLCAVPVIGLDDPIQVYAHFNKETYRKHSAEVFLSMLRDSAAMFAVRNNIN